MINKLKDFFGGYAAQGPIEWIVVGLGNPGRQYEDTRHNAGFIAADHLCGQWGIEAKRLKFKSLCGDGAVAGTRVLVMKPSTFMNNSGEAVRDAMQFYKVPAERVIVLFDDVSLEPGKMRIRRKGSDGGHNGIKNIIYLTGKDTFPRVKIGVGKKPRPEMNLADWVLSKFSASERKALNGLLENVREAVELMLRDDTDAAMNRFNS